MEPETYEINIQNPCSKFTESTFGRMNFQIYISYIDSLNKFISVLNRCYDWIEILYLIDTLYW